MASSAIRDFLIEFIADELELPASDINDTSELIADLGFDSLSFAMSVSEIKSRFGVVLTKENVFECKTFGALAELVENRILTASGAATATGNAPGDL